MPLLYMGEIFSNKAKMKALFSLFLIDKKGIIW
jgi:hypothetical protein